MKKLFYWMAIPFAALVLAFSFASCSGGGSGDDDDGDTIDDENGNSAYLTALKQSLSSTGYTVGDFTWSELTAVYPKLSGCPSLPGYKAVGYKAYTQEQVSFIDIVYGDISQEAGNNYFASLLSAGYTKMYENNTDASLVSGFSKTSESGTWMVQIAVTFLEPQRNYSVVHVIVSFTTATDDDTSDGGGDNAEYLEILKQQLQSQGYSIGSWSWNSLSSICPFISQYPTFNDNAVAYKVENQNNVRSYVFVYFNITSQVIQSYYNAVATSGFTLNEQSDTYRSAYKVVGNTQYMIVLSTIRINENRYVVTMAVWTQNVG